MEGKRPGLGDLILTREQPSQEMVDTFRTPIAAHQDYTVVFIDTTAFEDGGTLTIDIQVGRDDAIGIFHLLDGDKKLPRKRSLMALIPKNGTVSKVMNIRNHLTHLPESGGIFPGQTGQIRYQFDRGQRFKLCATGDQRGGTGTINAFHARISVEPVGKPESM